MKEKILEIMKNKGLHRGRCFGSKSSNSRIKPLDVFVFNSNIGSLIDGKIEKVWFGDINITKDYKILKEIAKEIGQDLFIYSEMAGKDEKILELDDAFWDTSKERITMIDLIPERELYLRSLLYWTNPIINKGFSINNVLKVREYVENKSCFDRFKHAEKYTFKKVYEDISQKVFSNLDRTNIKRMDYYRKRRAIQNNIYLKIKLRLKTNDPIYTEPRRNLFYLIHNRVDSLGFTYDKSSYFSKLHYDRGLFYWQMNNWSCESKSIY